MNGPNGGSVMIKGEATLEKTFRNFFFSGSARPTYSFVRTMSGKSKS
ncbi:MAG: hypothetical protein ACI9TH_000897 [Kiritimatiellia bacterium]|jgi:hypothetical protein